MLNAAYVRIGAIESFTSLSWGREYSACGKVELELLEDPSGLLQVGNFLLHGEEAAVIEQVVHTYEEDGPKIEVNGRRLLGLLDRRIVYPDYSATAPPDALLVGLVNANAVEDTARALNGLSARSDVSEALGALEAHVDRGESLLDAVEELAQDSQLGIDMAFVDASPLFRVYQGQQRRGVFAEEFDNLLSVEYDESDESYRNVAYVAGREDRDTGAYLLVQVGEAQGNERRETWIRANDVERDEDGNTRPEAEQLELMTAKGRQELANLPPVHSLCAEVNPYGNLVYRRDYDLGDIVPLRVDRYGVRMMARITGIVEIYEEESLSLEITFGNGYLTMSKRIKKGVL